MKEKKKKQFWIYLVIILLILAGAIAGVYLLKENKANNDSGDKTNTPKKNLVVEEDVEEITDDRIYIRKTFVNDEKLAKVEYKFENSMYELKINDTIIKNDKMKKAKNYQIEQLNDVVVIAIKPTTNVRGLSIFAYDFSGKQILELDDYVDAENYMSLREYGDSNVYDNWAFQITDSAIKVITSRVINGDIDGISNPCNKSEISKANFTNDTMMAALYSISYLGNSKFAEPIIEKVNVDYLQYKKIFSCK